MKGYKFYVFYPQIFADKIHRRFAQIYSQISDDLRAMSFSYIFANEIRNRFTQVYKNQR